MSEFTVGDWVEGYGMTDASQAKYNGKQGYIKSASYKNTKYGQAWEVYFPSLMLDGVLYESEMKLTDWNVDRSSSAKAKNEAAGDPVYGPSYYTGFSNGAEVIDIAEHLNFNRGNVVKYLCRADRKEDEFQDLCKALYYLRREIDRMEGSK
ncbi:DUF3310 domain-containing protein [Streptomyces chrestomyceticus]|uniref:DUF3310 domain-containing protein n=1 Tax=Streptomyces chrestomyceticus TaxID=68185 RepID=A0ABU7WLQ6_9ACTN